MFIEKYMYMYMSGMWSGHNDDFWFLHLTLLANIHVNTVASFPQG